ncbi:DUF2269 family protein [Roseateles saccharophilus]|uniref:Putative membrane protein n=1 Tax=Roseateles saccharophilus TaxID=304 RepID=A0A4R3V501_ROSSA|nr:DUF2269 domain-containing protein [Roseateles saccharophilus]MDG0831485.1 DUF2269 domain-containing protein [Roseateles saccharophilus]TCU98631.1 putative membrane protein [Roseateles saccharophilus]
MNTYLLVKCLHIVSSVLLVGTGFGSAFYLFFANRSASLEARTVVARLVVRADLWFTTPAVIVQPLSGLWLAHGGGWPLATPWLLASITLYALAGACWLPVLWLQLKMAREVQAALEQRRPLTPSYRRWQLAWEWLGYPAFAAMMAVFFLMVNKPALWG